MEEPSLLVDRCSCSDPAAREKWTRKKRSFQFPCTVLLFDDTNTKLKDTSGVRLLGVTQFLDCT